MIFLNIGFFKKLGNESNFSRILNEEYPTISLFRLTNDFSSKMDSRHEQLIGTKISGRNKYNANGSVVFSGIELPDLNFILQGRSICTYFFGKNLSTQKIEYFLPHFEYENFLMESCSIVIANEYLKHYGLEIIIDQDPGRFLLFSFLENQFGPVKYLQTSNKPEELELKLNLDKLFVEYSFEDVSKKDARDIPIESIFIVSDKSKFETDIGLISGSQIIGNEIRMLINLTLLPVTLKNKVERKIIE